MAKRLSDKQINEIKKSFLSGEKLAELAQKFDCTKLTISRKLKKILGEQQYKDQVLKRKSQNNEYEQINDVLKEKKKQISTISTLNESFSEEPEEIKSSENSFNQDQFLELAPIDLNIDNVARKDFSSTPLNEINFPKLVYMIVDSKIELVIKILSDYPEWEFLSKDDLKRKTIQIYFDLKNAKRNCGKDQKVIKVPNTNVFSIVSPLLLSRGISRIITDDYLISL